MRLEKVREKKKNRIRNRLIFRSIILAVLVAAVVFALVANAKKDNTIYKIGDQAPDFKLQQINKNNELESIQLSDLKGKGVMLNFWATFCKPCEKEDRKSTRLNSSHVAISYAVFCLKKKRNAYTYKKLL